METNDKAVHTYHGHAIKRIRESLKIKQEALAADLNLTQQSVSLYEQKKVIEDEMLDKFAKAMNVSVDLIKGLQEDPVTVIIENNKFEEGSIANVAGDNTNNYHPLEKIIELSNEKTALYERMLQLEREKIQMLEKLLEERK